MQILNYPLALLAFIGRQGTRGVAISIFVGLALPQLAAIAKPLLGVTVFVLLILSILRVDPSHLRDYFRAPKLIAAATIWIMILTPLALGGLLKLSGLQQWQPELFLVLILQVATTPITSSPAFAAMMGLDAALAFSVLFLSTTITWITTPAFAYLFAGSAVISPIELGLRSLVFYAGAIAAAALIFRFAGKPAIDRSKDYIDGINVLAAFIFAVAAMDGVAAQAIANPLNAFALLALGFAMTALLMAMTWIAFLRAGKNEALLIGIQSGSRNLGALIAVIGVSQIPDQIWLYFALYQIPMFLAPQFLKPLVRLASSSPR